MKVQWSGQISEGLDRLRTDFAQAHLVEHSRKLGVTLTEDMSQENSVLN